METSGGGLALDTARQELHKALQELLDLARETEQTLVALDALVGGAPVVERNQPPQAESGNGGATGGPDGVEPGSGEWERRVDELMRQLEELMVRRARLASAISQLRSEAVEAGDPLPAGLYRAIRDIDDRSLQRAHRQLRWWHSELEAIRGRRISWQGYRSALGKQGRRPEFVDRRV